MVKKAEAKREITVNYFHVDGYKHSITFTPEGDDKMNYSILNEHTTKLVTKGTV